MDQQPSLAAFSDLIQRYPDLNMTLIYDILEACNHDIDRAYAKICEMVIPPDDDTPSQPPCSTRPSATLPRSPKDFPPRVHSPNHHASSADHADIQAPSTAARMPLVSPRKVSTPVLKGAWASKNMGRRLRVDEMCNKYTWIRRSVVEDLFEKNGDCVELVENEVLQMFPIDEPAAFGDTPKSRRQARGVGESRQRVMAESLRAQAAEEMRRAACSGAGVSMASAEMQAMGRQLRETREARGRLHILANQTRKQSHIEMAKEKDHELQRLSDNFLAKFRQSDEFRSGVLDLHGLTKDEAIQVVEWKLQEGGRKRFRLITGKGNHSHNNQAVLKPALEKHFRSKRVSFTQIHDGVLSVTFP